MSRTILNLAFCHISSIRGNTVTRANLSNSSIPDQVFWGCQRAIYSALNSTSSGTMTTFKIIGFFFNKCFRFTLLLYYIKSIYIL